MFLSIDMLSEVPIYNQICHQVIRAIAMKTLKEGDELPSSRSLAGDIGVNLHTVNKAYNLLKQDGFLTVNRRKIAVVNKPENYASTPAYEAELKLALEEVVTTALARGVDYSHLDGLIQEIITEVKGDSL